MITLLTCLNLPVASELHKNPFSSAALTWAPLHCLSVPPSLSLLRSSTVASSQALFHFSWIHVRGLAFTLSSCQDGSVPSASHCGLFPVKCHLLKATRSGTLPEVLWLLLLHSVSLVSKITSQVASGLLSICSGAICHLYTVPCCVTGWRHLFETHTYITHDSGGFLPGPLHHIREKICHIHIL